MSTALALFPNRRKPPMGRPSLFAPGRPMRSNADRCVRMILPSVARQCNCMLRLATALCTCVLHAGLAGNQAAALLNFARDFQQIVRRFLAGDVKQGDAGQHSL